MVSEMMNDLHSTVGAAIYKQRLSAVDTMFVDQKFNSIKSWNIAKKEGFVCYKKGFTSTNHDPTNCKRTVGLNDISVQFLLDVRQDSQEDVTADIITKIGDIAAHVLHLDNLNDSSVNDCSPETKLCCAKSSDDNNSFLGLTGESATMHALTLSSLSQSRRCNDNFTSYLSNQNAVAQVVQVWDSTTPIVG